MKSLLLTEILIGHDGSPLSKALLNSGLGEDLSPHTGLDSDMRYLLFSVGLRGVKKGSEKKVEKLILDVLQQNDIVTVEDFDNADAQNTLSEIEGLTPDDIEAVAVALDAWEAEAEGAENASETETAAEEKAIRILFKRACHRAFELKKSSLYQVRLTFVNSAPLLS